ncbi:MAG: hypothetical protein HYX72_15155 [Acidobacteria bacterium]|nr:hypothetical protein [Acidobacteriota bacterium]
MILALLIILFVLVWWLVLFLVMPGLSLLLMMITAALAGAAGLVWYLMRAPRDLAGIGDSLGQKL